MAHADAAPDAASVPVMQGRSWAILAGALLVAPMLDAQLPYGLRAGRRDVAVRENVWYPASCRRHPPRTGDPCRDAAPDSGRFPLLLLGSGGRAPLDSVRAAYFASHGYVVVLVFGDFDAAWRAARELEFVDSTRVVVVGAGAGITQARRFAAGLNAVDALALVDPDNGAGLASPWPGDRIPVLSWRPTAVDTAAAAVNQVTVQLPPGPSDHLRLMTAVTHAFLDAVLERGPGSLSDLVQLLRKAGLTVGGAQHH